MRQVTTTTVLVTGASGRIGGFLRTRLARPGRVLRLLTPDPLPTLAGTGEEELVTGSVLDEDLLTRATAGVDAVVHLGGIPTEAAFDAVLETNVLGSRRVLEAAHQGAVRRVVIASSSHALGFRRREEVVGGVLPDGLPPRPDTYYGWSKAAVEHLAQLYADRFGQEVVSLRIGACVERPHTERDLAIWLSPDDVGRLVEAALTGPVDGHVVVWGVSRNTRAWWSQEAARALGYEATDDSEVFAADLLRERAEAGRTTSDAEDLRTVGGEMLRVPLGRRDEPDGVR
ncbi:NAD-dependent epimerase/dehydratase family protein [Lapillicoccus jejuensis]|uniref:NAD-dependent epimerase/dehydratase family protein n=1 Tax=Lapillicoccus jejuensis TaxID=402171 RepID=A0A542E0W2_9MICO|nr:NAD-dependent epimerase/dehydratase family protein [Lapillicoccus jejuensis]